MTMPSPNLPDITRQADVRAAIHAAVNEDVGAGDATTRALVPAGTVARAVILARTACVVAGQDVARQVFRHVEAGLTYEAVIPDGGRAAAGGVIARLTGPARAILTGERTALNFLQRMTGIATLTDRFVTRVKPYGTIILDTRKTTPTLRVFEKYAVRCGGGHNHRMGLYDRVMIKDNHRRLWQGAEKVGLDRAVEAARAACPDLPIEIEVENENELRDALRAGPEWILLDNMTPEAMRRCVLLCGGRSRLEASGGVTLDTIESVAQTGVDAISLGVLTHSAPAIDLSLEME